MNARVYNLFTYMYIRKVHGIATKHECLNDTKNYTSKVKLCAANSLITQRAYSKRRKSYILLFERNSKLIPQSK